MHGTPGPVTIDLNMLMRAYAIGIFPMADARDDVDVFWVEPEMRAILPLDGFRFSTSLRKAVRWSRSSSFLTMKPPLLLRLTQVSRQLLMQTGRWEMYVFWLR